MVEGMELKIRRRFLDSDEWEEAPLVNVSGSPIITTLGSSVPTLEECDRNRNGEYFLGSVCYNVLASQTSSSTLTVGCRTDESGKMVDTDVVLQSDQVKKWKDVYKDTPFHHTKPRDAFRGMELVLVADDQEMESCVFDGRKVKEAIEKRQFESDDDGGEDAEE